MKILVAAMVAVGLLGGAARAQTVRILAENTKASDTLKTAFAEATAEAGKATVAVKCDGKPALLGTVVSADGYVLTVASDLAGKVTVRLNDGKEIEAKVVGKDDEQNLALLKVDAKNLPTVVWADARKVNVGEWVATPGAGTDKPLAVGVISVGRRKIPHQAGVLGVSLADMGTPAAGARVLQVLPGTPAEKAGLQTDDVITAVAGKAVTGREEAAGALRALKPGDKVELTIKRGDKILKLPATLAATFATPGGFAGRFDLQNLMAGAVSKRTADFPAVLQHDTVLKPSDCGGPLVDVDGKVIGLNVSRAGRTETFAVPADLVATTVTKLMKAK